MVFIEPLLQREVHLHHYFHHVPSFLAKLVYESASGALMHGVDGATADSHGEFQKFHVDAFLFGAEGRIHYHQIDSLGP